MIRRCGMIAIALIATVSAFSSFTSECEARSRAEVRSQIRAMPILERPSRPGHIYGNTVRRLNR
jgi:hypothetical protein